MSTSSVLDKFERKTTEQWTVGAVRGFILFISNEDMYDTIKIVESWERSGLLLHGASESVKHKIIKKRQDGGFLPVIMASIAASLIAPRASSLM